jgi:hypothetical protein
MHIFMSIAMILAGILILVVGLIQVLRDLLARSPHEAPLIEDDGLAWPPRYQGSTASPPASDLRGGVTGFEATAWRNERERGQNVDLSR